MLTPGKLSLGSEDNESYVSPLRELLTASRKILLNDGFDTTAVDTQLWTVATASGGLANQTLLAGTFACVVNTTSGSLAINTSNKVARFNSGAFNAFHAVLSGGNLLVTTPFVTNNTRRWGAYNHSAGTPQNGVYYEVENSTLNACIAYGGTILKTASTAWSEDTTFSLDTSKHRYEIIYGNTSVYFLIDGVLRHKVAISGAAASVFPNQHWTVTLDCRNTSTTSEGAFISCYGVSVSTFGDLSLAQRGFYTTATGTTVLKQGAGMLRRVNILATAALGTITIYDNTAGSGTIIASFPAAAVAGSFPMDFPFSIGLTVVVATAAYNLQIIYD